MISFTVSVKEDGRLDLPQGLRAALQLQDQDALVFYVQPDGTAVVTSASTLVQRSFGLFAYLKMEDSETDTFLAERRAQADR